MVLTNTKKVELELFGYETPIELDLEKDIGVIRAEELHNRVHYLNCGKMVFINPEFFSTTFKASANKTVGDTSVFQLIKERKIHKVHIVTDTIDDTYELVVPVDNDINSKVIYGGWGDGGMIYSFSWDRK